MSFPVILLVTLQCIWLVHAGATHKNSHAPIKYPGPVKERPTDRYGTDSSSGHFIPKLNEIPNSCRDKTYCTEKAPTYPEEHFNHLYKGYKPVVVPSVVTQDPLNRQGDPDDKDDCDSEVKFEPLFHVKDENGAWRNVVQAPGVDYVQRVRLETCNNPGGTCFKKFLPMPGFQTFCSQTYNTWEVTVSTADGGTEKIRTELPVCCSCHFKTD